MDQQVDWHGWPTMPIAYWPGTENTGRPGQVICGPATINMDGPGSLATVWPIPYYRKGHEA